MTSKTDLPFYKCPRYSRCSVNNCPLHPSYPDLPTDENDPEKKCKVAKSIRTRIAAEFQGMLKYEGLTKAESQAKMRYDHMSDESKAKMKAGLSKVNSKRQSEANQADQSKSVCEV